MELLAPAGHWEAMVAAVQSGADAVYLGVGDYNARRGARNFSEEELLAAVSYCHLRGVKVHLTLNTLLSDRELPAALETLRKANRWGVDSVILQDWGLLALARQAAPDLPLHASTQMSLHTLSGVRIAAELGLQCAVLARELSGGEVRAIAQKSPIAVEVFGHGALCMCYSGQCAMSALIGGRSGNRGACAQPCRLPYAIDGGKMGRPLSLKDACLADRLGEMEGVSLLKLEGRMKRPEYVGVVTRVYADLLREGRRPTQEEMRKLEAAFSREGFTEGYWLGKTGPRMFGARPENAPEPRELFSAAKAAYEREDRRTVPVEFRLELRAGAPAALIAWDEDGHRAEITGPVPEAARTRPITSQEAEDRLRKTGGTVFRCRRVEVLVEEGLSLPASALNALRREALGELERLRTAPSVRRWLDPPSLPEAEGWSGAPELTVSLSRPEQLTAELLELRPSILYLPAEHFRDFNLSPVPAEIERCLVLPRIWRDGEEPALRELLALAANRGVRSVAAGNLGHLLLIREAGLIPRGDLGLNVFNSRSLALLAELGLRSATVSFELRHQQIRDLVKTLDCEAVVYGRLPLMVMENCLISNRTGCQAGNLQGDCRRRHTLTDRRGEEFPVEAVWGCRSELENSKVLFLADKAEWRQIGLRYARLRFTDESPADCVEMLRAYREGGGAPPPNFTRGLFYRGVT